MSNGALCRIRSLSVDMEALVTDSSLMGFLRAGPSSSPDPMATTTTAIRSRNAEREELLKSGMDDTRSVSADQRGGLLMSTDRLNNSTERIKESRRTMLETEELGVSILQDLHQQRQSLLHAHDTMYTRNGLLKATMDYEDSSQNMTLKRVTWDWW